MTTKANNWALPTGLSKDGKIASLTIRLFCLDHDLDSSEPVFYNPKGDSRFEYGENSLLVVMHELTDANRALSMDGAYEQNGGDYSLYEGLREALESEGLCLEQCTRYYSAVYAV